MTTENYEFHKAPCQCEFAKGVAYKAGAAGKAGEGSVRRVRMRVRNEKERGWRGATSDLDLDRRPRLQGRRQPLATCDGEEGKRAVAVAAGVRAVGWVDGLGDEHRDSIAIEGWSLRHPSEHTRTLPVSLSLFLCLSFPRFTALSLSLSLSSSFSLCLCHLVPSLPLSRALSLTLALSHTDTHTHARATGLNNTEGNPLGVSNGRRNGMPGWKQGRGEGEGHLLYFEGNVDAIDGDGSARDVALELAAAGVPPRTVQRDPEPCQGRAWHPKVYRQVAVAISVAVLRLQLDRDGTVRGGGGGGGGGFAVGVPVPDGPASTAVPAGHGTPVPHRRHVVPAAVAAGGDGQLDRDVVGHVAVGVD